MALDKVCLIIPFGHCTLVQGCRVAFTCAQQLVMHQCRAMYVGSSMYIYTTMPHHQHLRSEGSYIEWVSRDH